VSKVILSAYYIIRHVSTLKGANFMELVIFFLIFIVPGIIAAVVYGLIACLNDEPRIATSLIFDLLIFIINITGLYYCEDILTLDELMVQFNCLSFTRKYALLSILVGIILAVIFGLIRRLLPANDNE
jgi:hypothetical protein